LVAAVRKRAEFGQEELLMDFEDFVTAGLTDSSTNEG
jgi:hypothetical protein